MDTEPAFSAEYLAQDRGPVLVRLVVAFIVLETFFICAYLASRYLSHTVKGWDVYLMISAYFMQLANAAVALGKLEVDWSLVRLGVVLTMPFSLGSVRQ